MASFLKRARSTRDQRNRAVKHQEELAFTTANLSAKHIIIEDQENYFSRRPQANILKLRRKSFSSTRESKMALGLPESWDPPATETMTFEERKKRTSVFFGLSPAPPPVEAEHKAVADAPPRRAPPPPPILLPASAFPPRMSSTHGNIVVDGADDGEILDPNHYTDDEPGYIGMALGSPGGAVHEPLFTRSTENLPPARKSPAFFLPAEPFVVGTSYSTCTAAGGQEAKPEEQRPHGWKRLFGKSIFGRRGTIKTSRGATPEFLEPVPPPPAAAPPPTKLRKNSKTPAPPPPAPCLSVDIPSVEMERYSVMFDTVLSDPPKATIFARRRSKELNALFSSTESIPDGDDTVPRLAGEPTPRLALNSLKRNATTGSHLEPRSPLSMLGDNLKRISTEPSRSPSPQRPSTSPQPYTKENMLTPPPSVPALPLRPPSPLRSPRPVSLMSVVSEELPSPSGSFDAGDDKWFTQEAEPQWEMVTGPRAKEARSEVLANEATEAAMDALKEDPEKTEEEAQEEELVVAAQISIARQISVSRSQLLLPVVPEGKRLVGRRSVKDSMRPRLVQHLGPTEAVVEAV